MSWDNPPPPFLALPSELSDETVAQLLECALARFARGNVLEDLGNQPTNR